MKRLAPPSQLLLLTGFLATACVYMFFLEPWGHDTWFHLQRLQDIENQFGRGELRAYFAENAAQGKGLPVWIYYSQWVYWPAMLLTSLGVGPLVALKLIYCVSLAVCCLGCYGLLRLDSSGDAAAFGTLLFLSSNYVIGEIFQRSAYAEFLSVALFPPLLVTLHSTLMHRHKWSALALVLLSSLMILFHPLSFMNAGYALVAFAAYTAIRWGVPYFQLMRLIPLFSLALALTAFYWLPAVIETKYVLGAEGVPTPLHETFLTLWRYLNFSGPTNLGFVLTVFAPAVAGSLLLRGQAADVPGIRTSWPLLAGIFIYVFLTLRVSEPLYDAVSLLASNLWVWRVLFPMILLVVIFTIANMPALPQRLRSNTILAGLAGLGVLQATVFILWNTAADISIRPVEIQMIERELLVESQRTDGFGIDEYLPQPRMLPRPDEECGPVESVVPQGQYEMRFLIASDDNACIHVPRYWNTRYTATIDDDAIPVYANEAGEILVVPQGRTGLLTLRFSRPTYVTFSMYLSAAAAMLLLIWVVGRVSRERLSRSTGAATDSG